MELLIEIALSFQWLDNISLFTSNLSNLMVFIATILNFIIPVICYFIVRKIPLPKEKQVESMGIPDSIIHNGG